MAAHSLHRIQQIPVSLEVAWEFFSNAANLSVITPPGIGFKVISDHHGSTMYAGQILEYTVKPLFGIPMYWMTEITHVKHHAYFIDEQRFGPYKFWHHQHHFSAVRGGIEMTDIVHYKIPFGFAGRGMNTILVGSKLRKIFDYRFAIIKEKFGEIK